MAEIFPTVDGAIGKTGGTTWATSREATSGNSFINTLQRSTVAVSVKRQAGRGGSFQYTVWRSFFEFDVSDISALPTAAVFKLYGYINSGADFNVVAANFSDGSLGGGDFDSIVGSSSTHWLDKF